MTVRKSFILFFLLTLLSGCGGNGNDPAPDDGANDRQVILTHWADKIITPSYAQFKEQLDAMRTKSQAFTAAPTTNTLIEFRAAHATAYAEWQNVELFEFGPADKYTIRNFFNIYPANVVDIAANIANPASNLDVPAAYPTQGFPALDYLLNGVGADDAAILEYYTTDEDASARIAYVTRIVDRMNTLITNVITEWVAYREEFISETGLDIGSSMGLVINAYVLEFERYLRSGKIGIPCGSTIASAGVPYPEKIEAYYKRDISLTLAQNAHNAAVGFFNGTDVQTGVDGPSLKSYLDAIGAKDVTSGTALSVIINDQFDVINGKLDLLSEDFYEQIQSDNQKMKDTYTEMQKAVRMLKVDMTSAMSITITYTDNDGD